MMNKSLNILYLIIILIFQGVATSCRDDFGFNKYAAVPEGEEAFVTLTVSVPSMTLQTRDAGIDPESDQASTIHDLWIGIFNANTGIKTGEIYLTKEDIIKDHSVREIEIKLIRGLSGSSYIVGAANTQGLRGLDTKNGTELTDLKTLLLNTENWDDYKRIGGIMNNPLSTQRMGNIFMSGNYSESDDDANESLDQDNNPVPVAVYPGARKLSGTIHLKRVVAYNKFILIPHKAISFTPVSWKVMNVPGISYVHNRKNGSNKNAADNVMNPGVTFWSGNDDEGKSLNSSFYHNSAQSISFDKVFDNNDYNNNYKIDSSFDFYLLENKHSGIISPTDIEEDGLSNLYNFRELEHKQNERNTGWYKSLVETAGETIPAVPSSDDNLKNNNATFIVLKANMDYYYRSDDTTETPVVPEDNADVTNDYIHRVAEVTYTIHLGFCEGEGIDKANDFNCRRNNSYTYRILIGGASNIRVEVQNDTEPQPGMEGTVSDLITNFIDLDAHYGEFNIALNDRQRKRLIWRIVAPYENEVVDMVRGSKNNLFSNTPGIYLIDDKPGMLSALPDNQFYNWIQIRPTNSEGVLAHYPGDPRIIGRENIGGYPTKEKKGDGSSDDGTIYDYAKASGDKGVWYLETLKNAGDFPHPASYNGLTEDKIGEYKKFLKTPYTSIEEENREFDKLDADVKRALEAPHYYTVYVDEYVYEYKKDTTEPSLTGDFMTVNRNSEAWRTYVNNDNRKLWLSLNDLEISKDIESAYSNSIYLISQRSIQTYYNSQSERALGVEHINETFVKEGGIKHWDWNWSNDDNRNDGLLNLYRYFQSDWRKQWFQIWKNENGYLPDKETEKVSNYEEWHQEPMRACDPNNIGPELVRYVPSTINQEILMPMVRNRDLNNNNLVEVYEMRWYLPSAETYTAISLGSASLSTPLFQAKNFARNAITAGLGTPTSHYMTSDLKMFWAEEMASVSEWDWASKNGAVPSGNIRCIRNLGQELYLVPGSDIYLENGVVPPAYTHDAQNRIVNMEFYRSGAIRNEITTDPIPAHSVGDIQSLPTRKFEYYSEEFLVKPVFEGSDDDKSKDFSIWWDMIENFPEEKGLDGWRVPNINELAILWYCGVLRLEDGIRYISCSYEYFNNRNNKGDYGRQNHFILGLETTLNGGKLITNITANMKANEGSYILLVRDIE